MRGDFGHHFSLYAQTWIRASVALLARTGANTAPPHPLQVPFEQGYGDGGPVIQASM